MKYNFNAAVGDGWIYCPRCDKQKVMVPHERQGSESQNTTRFLRRWSCVECGWVVCCNHTEGDSFKVESEEETTMVELARHVNYINWVYKHSQPQPLQSGKFRRKILFRIAKLLRIPMYEVLEVGDNVRKL